MHEFLHTHVGKRASTHLVAMVQTELEAVSVAASAAEAAGLGPAQSRVLGPVLAEAPREALLGPLALPDHAGFLQALARAHVWLALVGAGLGWLVHAWFREAPVVLRTPLLSEGVAVAFGAVMGLLVGGVWSLRPDHALLLRWIRRELRQGHWVVLVQPQGAEQEQRAEDALSRVSRGPVQRMV